MANQIKAKDWVKWSHNGGYIFGKVINILTEDIASGSEKISATEKSPVAQVELFTGQTSYIQANLCVNVSEQDYQSAANELISNIINNSGVAGFEWGCEAYKKEVSAMKEECAKMKQDQESSSQSFSKMKEDYESTCKAKAELEAQIAKLQEDMQKANELHAAFKAETVAKERFAQLKELDAHAFLDKDPVKVMEIVKAMDESQFSNIVKVVTAAKTSLPQKTDQTLTSLPKSTDQTQTNLTKLTEAEVKESLDNAENKDDKALASVSNTKVNDKDLHISFVRENMKTVKNSKKNSK